MKHILYCRYDVLKQYEYDTKILKWNTAAWGEIPADYGRK
jgi:ribonuclease HI